MSDRQSSEIGRQMATTLEEIRILRADGVRLLDAMQAAHLESRARDEEQFAEMRALRETSDLQTAELQLQSAQLRAQTSELRRVGDTNQIHTDALRVLIERG